MSKLSSQVDQLAKRYVCLSLHIGEHAPYYVDAYYGPPSWRPNHKLPLKELHSQGLSIQDELTYLSSSQDSELAQRISFLLIQTRACVAYIKQLMGKRLTYRQECQLLYDARPPHYGMGYFDDLLSQLDKLVSGSGDLANRLASYRQQFVVPLDKLDVVFSAAIDQARLCTLQYIPLPSHENFEVSLTNNQVWSAYNWYQGHCYSKIELNTDHPIYIERVIDLAAHEGYPGHHVFNALLETELVNKRGWLEYSIYNLYSPVSLLAEGSANYGIEVVFPKKERLIFERSVLFPLAGLDASMAEQYYEVQSLLHRLSYIDNMIAQRLIDGEIDDKGAIDLLMTYGLNSADRAKQRLAFIKHNGAYVMTYNYGQDLVRRYVQNQLEDDSEQALWQVFTHLLSMPKTASMMAF